MNKIIHRFIIVNILIFVICLNSTAQKDTLFWFSAPEVNRYHTGGNDANPTRDCTPIYLHLTTFEEAANITISMPANSATFNGGSPIVTSVAANTTLRLDLSNYFDHDLVGIFNSMENQLDWTTSDLAAVQPYINKGNKGIVISSDQYITAYFEIGVLYNMDLISLKGNNALGKQFFVPFQTSNNTRDIYTYLYRPYSSIDIVATEDNTKILVTTDKAIWAKDGVPQNKPAGTHTVWLDKGETSIITPYAFNNYVYGGKTAYQTSFYLRLSGSYVEVDTTEGSGAPIAVISHDDLVKSNVTGNPDYVVDQLVPIQHIGTDYAVIQGPPSSGIIEDWIFVVATEDGTNGVIKTGPTLSTDAFSLNAGEYHEFSYSNANHNIASINADKPVYVYHMSGAGRQKAGAIIPTISKCTGSYKVAFNRTKAAPYDFFLTILARNSGIGNFELRRNNAHVTDPNDLAVEAEINDPTNYNALPEAGYPYDDWSYTRINAGLLTDGQAYLLVNTDNFFHLGIINGHTNNDAFYGYFSNFNEIEASAQEVSGRSSLAQVCEGDTIYLEATGGTTYSWSPTVYLDDPNIATPVAVLPPGIYNYNVHVVGDCVDTTLTIQLESVENPDAFFTLSEYNGCAPLNITMQNQSEGSDVFRWDFTNNASWDLETYDSSGTVSWSYDNVSLTDSIYSIRMLARRAGVVCTDEFTSTLQVFPRIDADFTLNDSVGCNPLSVNFTNNSTGNLDKFQWVLGDGTVSNTSGNVSHDYSHVNTSNTVDYDMELRVTSPYFCRDTARATISVYSYLEGEFTIDTAYGCSPLDVLFTNVSAGESQITLDYGDGSPPLVAGTFASISHTYTNTSNTVDTNIVILTVVNDSLCVREWRDTIIVYPEVSADYTIDDPGYGDLYWGCNSRIVTFQNLSNDGTHTASEYLWTFGDGSNSNSNVLTPFTHTYNNITTNDKFYALSLHAESQYGCYDDTANTITIFKARANFTVDADEGCSPLGVNITNTSVGTNIGTWLWDYDDGTTDPNENAGTHLHTYNNPTGATQLRDLSLTVTHNTQAWCTTNKIEQIDVYSEIDVNYTTNPAAFPICDSVDVAFNSTITPNIAGTVYEWDFGDGTSSNIADPTHNYRNLGNTNQVTYNVQVDVETPDGCTDLATGTVDVNPYVRAFFTIDESSGCSPHSITVTPANYLGIDEYRWDFDGDATFDVVAASNVQQNFTFPSNTTGADIIYNVTLEVADPTGTCTDTYIIPVTVYSESKADFNPQGSIDCNKYTLTFDNLSFNAVDWQWDFDDLTSSSAFEPTHTFVNTIGANKTYNVNLEVTSNRGCTHDTTAAVSVYSYVKADFDIDVSEGCSPLTVNISNNSSGTDYYWFWDDDDLTLANADSTITTSFDKTYYYSNGGPQNNNLTLIVGNGNGCYDTLTKTITVNSSIDAQFTFSQPDSCNKSLVQFTNTTLYSNNYNWDFGDGTSAETASNTISKTFTNNTLADYPFTVTLTAESAEGCSSVATDVVTVYSFIKADFDIDVSEGCSPLTVNISNNSSGTEYYWFWDDDDLTLANADSTLATSFDKTYYYSNGGTDVNNLTLIIGNGKGCYDTLTKTIDVNSSIDAQFTFSQPDSCNQSLVQFTNTTLYSNTYNWDFGDGSSAETASNTISKIFTNNTLADYPFTVTLTAESAEGCSSIATDVVTVYSYIEANFDIDVSEGCSPLTVNISNNSSGTEYYWFWDDSNLSFGNADSNSGNASIPVTYTNTAGGSRTDSLTLIIGNNHGCYDTLKRAVEVWSSIDAQFTYSQPDSCNKSNVQFTNTTANANSFKWNFGDGTSLETTSMTTNKTFTNNTTNDYTFTVVMTAESAEGCTDQATDNVTVYSRLIAGMSIPSNQDCPPFNTSILNTSTGNAANTYRWFVDGTEEFSSTGLADFTYTYNNTNPSIRNYTVRMEAANPHGCTDDTTATITVFEYVEAQFAINDNDGCTGHTVTLDNQSIAPATNTNYFWSFGDGASSSLFEPSHPFVISSRTQDKTFRILLTATSENYCKDTISDTVRIYHQPLAKFSVSETADCPPLETTINNFDSRGFSSFEWIFGDGNTRLVNSSSGENWSYSYPNATDNIVNYELKLWVGTDKGCTHTDSTTLSVFPAVHADFDIDDDDGCSAHVAEFMNASSSPATQFYWDFNDGSNDNKDTVFHRFVNDSYTDRVFNVRLTATSDYNCWDDTVKPVTVYTQPKALFNPTPTAQKFPEATVWMNSTSNNLPWDYLWEFGDQDNSTSTSSNLEFFEYEHWGEKDITLTLTSQTSSCNDQTTKTIIIYPPEVNADFITDIDGGCLDDGLEVQFTAESSVYSEVYTYTWDFGDGTPTIQGQNVSHTYTDAGIYHVKMTAEGEGGDDYEYKTIRVYSNPVADFKVVPHESMIDAVTLEARVEFYNQTVCNDTAGCSYVWYFGDGNTSFATNVTHYYEKPPDDEIPKEFDITLVATNSYGCVDSITKEKDVTILGEGEIHFPNAFVPESTVEDNRTFKPFYSGIIKYELLIYNRWGELIFKTNDLNEGWDGTVAGEPAKPDVYVWKAEGNFTNGRAFELAGDVTLIR